ncbi:class I SAM-dependent methyltransferase [Streptacidiphilus sp. PB12-B1b]|uniref:SAM-dependent methyltransferase n=1 Tax=Streptacidiphilus sp. PB12-B1b TaxID=2705012 RepID=UPI0015FC1B39|nr:cyclopropane-fatty-acyl-phospholipid synthase family protein [Streptacidiphilus sp. PB12-B1b]QMU76980.1 class I SAM-dependent methyltransferase [Streptacidiphilus sp. PB12-B1b]
MTTTQSTASGTAPGTTGGAAERLAELLRPLLGDPLPIRLTAWDGSSSGPADAPGVQVRSRDALRRLLWNPGELGLAEAYIAGEIEVDGDLGEGLARIWQAARSGAVGSSLGLRDRIRATALAVSLGAVGPRPAPPDGRAALSGALHSKARDRAVIHHHYDLSNDFYALLLDPSMAYSCAYWTSEDPDYTLADAQRDKLDLVCRKLGLEQGSRLLDIGCGWGSLTLHAARSYGAKVTALTLSEQQHAYVTARAAELGLAGQVDVQLRDYRDYPTQGVHDAVSTIEMGEHVGKDTYPAFARMLRAHLRPGGRLLVQQMSRRDRAPGGGAFIETYIAPDMHMRPVGDTVALLEDADLEVREVQAMREHYARTIDAWHDTLEQRWDEFTALVGEQTARVWRLYLVGGALAFRERRMGVDQILAVRAAA